MSKEVEQDCYHCKFYIREYNSRFNGKGPYCSEYTNPTFTCRAWAKKVYKERLVKYPRRIKD